MAVRQKLSRMANANTLKVYLVSRNISVNAQKRNTCRLQSRVNVDMIHYPTLAVPLLTPWCM